MPLLADLDEILDHDDPTLGFAREGRVAADHELDDDDDTTGFLDPEDDEDDEEDFDDDDFDDDEDYDDFDDEELEDDEEDFDDEDDDDLGDLTGDDPTTGFLNDRQPVRVQAAPARTTPVARREPGTGWYDRDYRGTTLDEEDSIMNPAA